MLVRILTDLLIDHGIDYSFRTVSDDMTMSQCTLRFDGENHAVLIFRRNIDLAGFISATQAAVNDYSVTQVCNVVTIRPR